MDFTLSPEQQQIREEVRKLCMRFDDSYWLDKDRSGEFPHELHAALAEGIREALVRAGREAVQGDRDLESELCHRYRDPRARRISSVVHQIETDSRVHFGC